MGRTVPLDHLTLRMPRSRRRGTGRSYILKAASTTHVGWAGGGRLFNVLILYDVVVAGAIIKDEIRQYHCLI